MSRVYTVVTISNRVPQENYYTYQYLQKSVGSDEILILGQEQGEYTGLSDKPRILYNAIKSGKITTKYIIFVDAWDVIFVDSPSVIMEKFFSLNTKILIGAEKNCYPSNFQKEYDRLPHTSSYRYLNSGVIIGETEAILEVLEAMDAPNLPVDYHDSRKGYNHHFNDQAYYMDIFLRQPVKMRLDYDCLIAQNMQDVIEDEIAFFLEKVFDELKPRFNQPILNIETKSKPSIIHWNGGSKTGWSREKILNYLNLL